MTRSAYDAIVVGSGPAGTFTAFGLDGLKVLVVDVGHVAPDADGLDGNLYELRQQRPDMFTELIGEDFQALRNLTGPKVNLKLKAPQTEYVIKDWSRLMPVEAEGFEPMASFARGGLANAWGAGVFRFDERDLESFPFSARELAPFYDELTDHVGICGADDDLAPWFGSANGLMNPMRLSPLAQDLLAGYQQRRGGFDRAGVAVGRPRLAVLTDDHRDRSAYDYDGMEFFKLGNRAIYNPAFTLEELLSGGTVEYLSDRLALSYKESSDGVELTTRNTRSGVSERYTATSLFLAAGTLGTSKLVLESAADHSTRLPILDNPITGIPLLRPRLIGTALDASESSLGQLCVLHDPAGIEGPIQGTFYGGGGPLRSDVIFDLPLPASAAAMLVKQLASAMGLLMMFSPGVRRAENYLRLKSGGALEIHCRQQPRNWSARPLIQAFRSIGFQTLQKLWVEVKMGQGLHYAGSLPMHRRPGPYQTSADGLLHGCQRVYVTDGACFSALPAKNLTFTIMANALRIARKARATL
jgi:choline dehydrogenase-like flavoprotein